MKRIICSLADNLLANHLHPYIEHALVLVPIDPSTVILDMNQGSFDPYEALRFEWDTYNLRLEFQWRPDTLTIRTSPLTGKIVYQKASWNNVTPDISASRAQVILDYLDRVLGSVLDSQP